MQGADPRTRGAWASDQVDRKHQSRCRVHRKQWLNFDIAMGWVRSAGERGCSHRSDGRGHQQLGTGQSSTLLGEKLQLAPQYFSHELDR